jgi:hypothetical protein
MSGTHVEAFFGADAPLAAKDGLIYKEILREGDFKYTPTSQGLKPIPFRVVREGTSDRAKGVISLADLKRAFDAKAYEHVQVPLTDEPGKDHKDIAAVNTGFVDDLQIREGSDGLARAVAGIRFTEPDAKAKVERGTVANCSSGIWFDRLRPSDGASFPVALRHVALTNTPFVDRLAAFGLTASEEDGEEPEETLSVEFSEVVWSPNESFSRLQANVQKAFEDLTNASNPMGIDDPNAKILFPRDIWTGKALAEDMKTGQTVVVPFKRKKGGVELAPQDEWTPAEQEWIAASEASPIRVHSKARVEERIAEVRREREQQSASQQEQSVQATEAKPKHDTRTPQGRLKKSQEDRRARILMSDDQNHRGGATSMSGSLDLSTLELSDEDRATIQAALDENDRLKKEQRTAAVEAEVKRVQELGLSEQTGFVKLYRRLLLADDGGEAIVLSDENTGEQRGVTITQALKTMIDALPKNTEGKIVLSDQALAAEAGTRPADDDAGEQETIEEAIEDTRRRLGLTN